MSSAASTTSSQAGASAAEATALDARKYTKDGRLYANQHETDETPDEYKIRILEDIAEDPTGYFQRGDVPRLERDMEEALLDDWQFAKFLRVAVRDDIAPRNPDACKRFGRICEYFPICTGAGSLEDPSLYVRVDDPNTELSGGLTVPIAVSDEDDSRGEPRYAP